MLVEPQHVEGKDGDNSYVYIGESNSMCML